LKTFLQWYNEDQNPESFFIDGIDLSKMSDAYLKQNTKNSLHSSALIKAQKK